MNFVQFSHCIGGDFLLLSLLMSEDASLLNPPLAGLEMDRKADEPCTIVIFGASGDLTARKLIPALFHLYEE